MGYNQITVPFFRRMIGMHKKEASSYYPKLLNALDFPLFIYIWSYILFGYYFHMTLLYFIRLLY